MNDACYPANCAWLARVLGSCDASRSPVFYVADTCQDLLAVLPQLVERLATFGLSAIIERVSGIASFKPRTGLHIVSHTADPKCLQWRNMMLQVFRRHHIKGGLCFSVPSIMSTDPEEVVAECQVLAWGSIRVSWQPYDSIEHFLPYAWPHFRERQSAAAERIFGLLRRFDLHEIHDVGCGSGDILHDLVALYRNAGLALPALYAYDPSEYQVDKARLRLRQHATVNLGELSTVRINDREKGAVLLLGNTLAHIGASPFRKWLRQCVNKPRVILLDFAAEWKQLLRQAIPEIVCGHVNESQRGDGFVLTHMTTAGGPGWVKRGVMLEFSDTPHAHGGPDEFTNTAPMYSHRLFTRQYADEPETYQHILDARGYKHADPGHYVSGWGEHDLYMYELTGNPTISWPNIADTKERAVCDAWYEVLVDTWSAVRQLCVGAPLPCAIAIVPFCHTRVYARYIKMDDFGAVSDLFAAWMWVVDPRNDQLSQAGATKTEDELPYAPSIYRLVLGTGSCGLMQSLDVLASELRLDLNASDMELAELERRWISGDDAPAPKRTVFYGIPVFHQGLLCYVLTLPVDEMTHPSAYYGGCKLVADRARAAIESLPDERIWTPFIEGMRKRGLTADDVLALTSTARKWPWTNWLEDLPGVRQVPATPPLRAEWTAQYYRAVRTVYPVSPDRLKVGIICALPEEFEYLRKELGLEKNDAHCDAGATTTMAGAAITMSAWCAYDMGQVPMGIRTARLLFDAAQTECDIWFLIGIAAGLKDCQVGDVLIVEEVDFYSKDMEAIPNATDTSRWDMCFGGRAYHPSSRIPEWAKRAFCQPTGLAWQERAQRWIDEVVFPENRARLATLLKRPSKAIVGALASGDIVAKAKAFHNKLRERNRGYNALDMESAAFLAAAEVATRSGQMRGLCVVLRGISDPGDESKKEIEECFAGRLRELATINSANAMRTMLERRDFRELVAANIRETDTE